MLDVELWVVVDASGDYVVSKEGADEAWERHDEEIGGNEPKRCVKVKLSIAPPSVVELTGTVPAESSDGATLTVS